MSSIGLVGRPSRPSSQRSASLINNNSRSAVVDSINASPAQEAPTPLEEENNVVSPSASEHQSKLKVKPTTITSLRKLITTNWYFNIFLITVPIGIAFGIKKIGDVPVFVVNFLAIIPLAKLLNFATEELALALGPTIGGLLNVTLGNAVELIVGIIALEEGLTTVVQASILGSILSNLLFVLGFCFFCGGLYYKEQFFSIGAANTSASLLSITVLSFLLPAAFHAQLKDDGAANLDSIIPVSRAVAILLLVVYMLYLNFQFRTHPHLFDPVVAEVEEEEATLTLPVAFGALIGAAALIGVCAEFLVGSIEGLAVAWGVTESFIGLIILPIVGNAAEHVTAVTVAMKNKMDLALSIALGSSMQIALLVTPIFIIIGWGIGVNLTMDFPIFQTAVVFITVFIVTQLVGDGKSNYLEGCLLLVAYLIVAVSFYYIPK